MQKNQSSKENGTAQIVLVYGKEAKGNPVQSYLTKIKIKLVLSHQVVFPSLGHPISMGYVNPSFKEDVQKFWPAVMYPLLLPNVLWRINILLFINIQGEALSRRIY